MEYKHYAECNVPHCSEINVELEKRLKRAESNIIKLWVLMSVGMGLVVTISLMAYFSSLEVHAIEHKVISTGQ